uniref:Uncharacterized protein n=1 Tax=Kalanchoe fedtschenkoi TaxID=63787 RepID=A0A7N0VFW4_KALFE
MITQKECGIILPLEKLSLMLIPHRPVPFPLSVRAPNLKMLSIRDCRFRNLSLQYCPKVASCTADDDEAAIECIEAQGRESNNLNSVVTVKIQGIPSKVKISNVSFKNIWGTTTTREAVNLICSKGFPCQNVEVGNIDLVIVILY